MSDSTGETGEQIAKSTIVQFPNLSYQADRLAHISSEEEIDEFLNMRKVNDDRCIIFSSIVDKKLDSHLMVKAKEYDFLVVDLFDRALDQIAEYTGVNPVRRQGLLRELDSDYFSKIESIEFAVKYDDGRDKRGFELADIVLIGVSRTSKTPLSMLLAYKNFKVANLPLVPEISVPDEIYRVDPNKIIGLIIDPESLNEIRKERLDVLGLKSSEYADNARIEKELKYAKEIFDELGCKVINVSSQTIEQTAQEITQYIKKNFTSLR